MINSTCRLADSPWKPSRKRVEYWRRSSELIRSAFIGGVGIGVSGVGDGDGGGGGDNGGGGCGYGCCCCGDDVIFNVILMLILMLFC